ncbi:MAG: PqqD family peptide modification chaperone, partial [bacterium]|nr:PqqD family peptide modification chaperone [bacterium]
MNNTSIVNQLTMTSKITLIKELDVTDLAGEKVMIDFSTGKYFLLKGVANDIWDYIQSPITVGEIVDKLLSQYEVDK